MTTTYNQTRCAELVREMREDDARMTRAPWRAVASPSHEHYGRVDSPSWPVAQVLHDFDERPVSDELSESACSTDDTIGIARTRNRLRETADQLEAAGARITELETRQQELLQTIVRLTNETPYPERVRSAVLEAIESVRRDTAIRFHDIDRAIAIRVAEQLASPVPLNELTR